MGDLAVLVSVVEETTCGVCSHDESAPDTTAVPSVLYTKLQGYSTWKSLLG